MNYLESDDISILFKKLILLPEDKSTAPEKEDEKEAPTYSSDEITEKTATIVQESTPEYTAPKLIVLIPKDLLSAYLESGSAFMKIVSSLKIEKVTTCISHEIPKKDDLLKSECIWAIGWDISTEKKLLAIDHTNLLASPEILGLTNNEEKRAMFSPLKDFINKNKEVFT